MRECGLAANSREMLVWHSAQDLLPTKPAPAISGAEVRASGSVEHEFKSATPATASSTEMRPAAPLQPVMMLTQEKQPNPIQLSRSSYTLWETSVPVERVRNDGRFCSAPIENVWSRTFGVPTSGGAAGN